MNAIPGLDVFARLKWHLTRNQLRGIRGENWVRPASIAFSSLLVAGFGFGTSLAGFAFLRQQKLPLGGDIVGLLLDLFFLTLATLLCLSTGLILFGSLFDSPEASFLLAKPVPDDRVFAHQFAGALLFSSAALILLALPLLWPTGFQSVRGPSITSCYQPISCPYHFSPVPSGPCFASPWSAGFQGGARRRSQPWQC